MLQVLWRNTFNFVMSWALLLHISGFLLGCVDFQSKHPVDINTSVLVVRGEPVLVILDYCVYPSDDGELKEAR